MQIIYILRGLRQEPKYYITREEGHMISSKRLGVKFSANVQQTQVMCKHCNVYLYAKCFFLFHDFKSV
jgi:hypothetical protein